MTTQQVDLGRVLVLTADTSTATRRKALAMGADDFLTKPVDVVEMTLRTKHLLRLREVHEALLASEENLASQVEERTRDLRETLTKLETTMELATQTEERYRSVFESIPVGVLRSNARTEILEANPAALRILSIPDLATARGLSMAELFENQDAVHLALEEGTREGYVVGHELPMTALNGRGLWLRGFLSGNQNRG